jgi:hypothetical protein
MSPSGTVRYVAYLRTDVLVTVMMEELRYSEASVITRATQSSIPEDGIHNSHRRENLKSYVALTG